MVEGILEAETASPIGHPRGGVSETRETTTAAASGTTETDTPVKPPPALPKRFHGTVALDPLRPGADAGRVGQEVIAHLSGLPGARVQVTLEIEAIVPEGVPENVARIVTENARTLKVASQGFEPE